jgi:polyisoprenoid-binding protein YceI
VTDANQERVSFTARLTMHGISRVVTFPVSGRRDGTKLRLTGVIPVTFAAWHITGRPDSDSLGSLANHGVAEFLLVLTRA